MRIYFIGSHSSGKTTLARYVSSKYNLPMLTEVARTVLSEKELSLDSLRTDLEIVNSYQNVVFQRQFEEEKKQKNFVSDRSFDNLAYMAQHSTVLAKSMQSPELATYVDNLRKNDVILFFIRPSRATMKNDGVRESLNWDGVIAIDAMVKLLLEMWNLNYISVNTDSIQERARLIDAVMTLKNITAF